MKNTIRTIAAATLAATLVGCSAFSTTTSTATTTSSSEDTVITVGATEVPHAKILEDVVAGILEEEGYTLEVTVFSDYVQPNTAVEEEELDANYFETLRYLNEENEERGLHLVAVAGVHLEPMGIYSNSVESIEEIPEGASVAIPNDGSNESRAIQLLADNGLIEVDASADLLTPEDVTSNPHNYEFVEVEAGMLTHSLDDVDIAVINGNYALEAGLSPSEDALASEETDTEVAKQYINYLVVKEGNEETDKTKALISALQSDEVKEYIESNYSDGSVIPAFVTPEK